MTVTTTPNKVLPETSKQRIARLARQRIGSTAGVHAKTLALQEAEANKKKPKDRFVLKPIHKDPTS